MKAVRKPDSTAMSAAGYVRVSQKAAAENGYGLDAQEADIRRNTDYMKWELVTIYREKGVSGYVRARPELERLLSGAREKLFDVVVFPSIDRMARSVRDAIDIEKRLRASGVGVVFLREGIDTSTPIGTFLRNVMSSIAEYEGKLIRERLYKGYRAKAAQGGYTGAWLAYGYRYRNGRVVVVDEEAEVVRKIFEWRAEGRSLLWIKRNLDGGGILTQHGKRWHRGTIRGISLNRFYAGYRKFDGDWVKGQHPAIITAELYTEANHKCDSQFPTT